MLGDAMPQLIDSPAFVLEAEWVRCSVHYAGGAECLAASLPEFSLQAVHRNADNLQVG